MKSKAKWEIVVINELRTQWRIFIVFFLIMFVLLTSAISINTLNCMLKDEFEKYIKEYGIDSIDVNTTTEEIISVIESMPVRIDDVSAMLSGETIGININKDYNLDGESIITQGCATRFLKNGNSRDVKYLNETLLEGDSFLEDDNQKAEVWIEKYFADMLGVKCGDIILMKNEDRHIKATVKGIYPLEQTNWSFVTTDKVLDELYGNNNELRNVTFSVDGIENYFKVVNDLKENFISFNSQKEEIRAIMLIIYGAMVVNIIVIMLTVSFCASILKMYYVYRKEFFIITKTQGLSNDNITKIILTLMEMVYVSSFAVALLISPFLNRYLVNSINKIFDGLNMKARMFDKNSLWILSIGIGMVCITCIIKHKTFESDEISESLNKGNE